MENMLLVQPIFQKRFKQLQLLKEFSTFVASGVFRVGNPQIQKSVIWPFSGNPSTTPTIKKPIESLSFTAIF